MMDPWHCGAVMTTYESAACARCRSSAATAAREAGFDAYLTKPIKLDQLCNTVRELARAA